MVDTVAAKSAAGDAPNTKQVSLSATQALEAAGKFFTQRRYADAEDMAKQVLKFHPNHPDAWNILAVSQNAQGNPKEAVNLLHQAIKRVPGNAIFHANLGEIERQRGRLAEALKALNKAVALDPNQASAHNNLGILNFDKGNYKAAYDCYQKAIEANPRFAEAYNNLGNVARLLRLGGQAVGFYHKALQFKEIYPEAYNNLGTLLRDQGKYPEAEHAFRKAMMQKPKYIEAFNNLAQLMFIQGNDQEALRVLSDALRVQEDHPGTLTITARVQLRRGNYAACETAANRALAVSRANPDALVALGQLYHETDRYEEAIQVLEEALQYAPRSPEAHNFYGVALKSVGRLEEGKQQLLQSLALNPNNYGAYANLNDLVDFKTEPGLVENMEKIFASAANPDDPRLMPLHFGFAKALEDLGEYPRALDHYLKGTSQKRAQLQYNEADTFKFYNDIKETFNEDVFRNRPFPGLPNNKLVFIMGMPRSGSTLVEQILSAHPDVFGAGEVKHLARALGQIRDRFPSMPVYPQLFTQMEPFHFETIGKTYLRSILPMAGPSAKKITDKLLTNYFFAGLIHLIFPHAKIVHTVRNPVDTCLSAYTKLFKDDMPHSYDFDELGRYYLEYRAIMEHWHKVLPEGTILDVNYEDVVGDVEGKARELIDFIGLDWNPACVNFHDSKRPVKTASVAQVRKPVYTGSVERWRRYGPGLQPLIDALGYVPGDAAPKKGAPAKRDSVAAPPAEPAPAKTKASAKGDKKAISAAQAEPAAAKEAPSRKGGTKAS